MARAKQTDRAEARRRARLANRPADTTDLEGDELEGDEDSAPVPDAAAGRRAVASGPREIPRRPGFGSLFSSFGTAYRRPNVREDLAALPSLLVTKGFLAGIGLILIGAIVFAIWPGYSGSTFAFQFLTFPPALAPIFVAGFFAPRASYLLGLVVGLFDAVVYSIWLLAALPSMGTAANPSDVGLYIGTAVFWSAVTGIVFGGGAAWYRRFLQLTSPRRQAQAGKGGSSRNQGGRRTATATSGRRRY